MCTGPLVKFSLVKSHLLESWRASLSTSLTSENLVCVHTGESRRQARRQKLVKENLPVCTGPLVKFSLVKSHLLKSWRASFPTSLTSENLVCVHTGESRRQTRREKLVSEHLLVCTGLNRSFSKRHKPPLIVQTTFNGEKHL